MYLSFFGIALQFVLIWSLYTNDAGRYHVLTPQKMETQYKILNTSAGEVYTYTSFVEWSPQRNMKGVFMINYYDLLDGQHVQNDAELALDLMNTISDELMKVFVGKIVYESDISFPLVHGKLLRLDYNNGQSTMKAKVYIKNNRVYVLQVMADKSWALHESIDKFLDSFEILD